MRGQCLGHNHLRAGGGEGYYLIARVPGVARREGIRAPPLFYHPAPLARTYANGARSWANFLARPAWPRLSKLQATP
jgi:hypothetical protein